MTDEKRKIRILLVEDSEDDAVLLFREINKCGYDPAWTRVERAEDMEKALDDQQWDIIISDYMLPEFSGKESLKLLKSRQLDIPFIVISGEISDQDAVEMLKNGAQDFIRKNNLSRLVPAIERELAEAVIRKRKIETEEALHKSREQLNNFMNSATDVFILLDSELRTLEINRQGLENLGLNRKEAAGKKITELYPYLKKTDRQANYRDIIETGIPLQFYDIIPGDESGNMHLAIKAFRVSGGLGLIISDISELKKAEEKIRTSLHEKEILLKEIHHRVKNNMQIISSLLNLQVDSIEDKKAREKFQVSINRLHSMALVHEKLYRSKNFSEINFKDYIISLSHELHVIYGIDPDKIKMEVNIDDSVALNINHAIPCGLLINEIIMNTFKHAFPGDMTGKLTIDIIDMDESISITIHDSGIGMTIDTESDDPKTLGLMLIKNLVKQVKGNLEIETGEGTKYKILIPRDSLSTTSA